MGVIVRNAAGEVVAARGFLDPCATEAWAGLQAIRLGKELHLSHIELEGDAKVVVDSINSVEKDRSTIGHVVEPTVITTEK
jgi:hypothetical protein